MILQSEKPLESPPIWPAVKTLLEWGDRATKYTIDHCRTPQIATIAAVAVFFIILPPFLPFTLRKLCKIFFPHRDTRKLQRRVVSVAGKVSKYALTWAPVAIFLLVGIFLIHDSFWRKLFVEEDWSEVRQRTFFLFFPMTALIATSLLVIAVACITYMNDILELYTEREDVLGVWLKKCALALCLLCTLLSISLGWYVWYTARQPYSIDPKETATYWDQLTEINEMSSLVIFMVFIAIDVCVYQAAKRAKSHAPSEELGVLAWEALWIVDVPCVTGVAFIMCLHDALHEWMSTNVLFTVGLSAGAIAIHVAITQAAFAVMKTRGLLKGMQSEIEESGLTK